MVTIMIDIMMHPTNCAALPLQQRPNLHTNISDEEGAYAAKDLLQRQGMSKASWKGKTSEKTNLGSGDTKTTFS
ncbi:hypothetical protein TSUD_239130 [Trifolium subterraneum]|uniref:Uncharacterized protein n=1 Tax=Trifolium subterraneum TaxID=3900 RepID=A0A2Z6NLU1_TRISU|nr:hypothetical protein TSUD_239130 [Trifolium subterraneum]